jgi:hypothetical protein
VKNGAIHVSITPIVFDGGMTSRIHTAGAALALTALVLAGCSKDAGNSAKNLIEGELQDQIGLGPLEAECGQPAAFEAGETFTCTATTEDDRVIEFLGVMTDSDSLEVNTSNLLTAQDVTDIRGAGAEAIGVEVGATISADDIVCPNEIELLDDTGDFTCEITDTETGDVFELLVSTGGIEPGVGLRTLDFNIGEQLR